MNKLPERFKSDTNPVELSWEADIRINMRRSEQRAWRIAIAALVCLMGCIVALVLLIPLKRTVPYVIAMDKLTGDLSVMSTGQSVVDNGLLMDKHWIQRFVLARESYRYPLLQLDYNTVRLLAAAEPWQQYDAMFQGKDALQTKYGNKIRIDPSITSITVNEDRTATVRLDTKTVRPMSSEPPITRHLIATLRFAYDPAQKGKESDLIENPLGFSVVAYRVDQELISSQDGGQK